MNVRQLTGYFSNPATLQRDNITDLEQLTDEYPYWQGARLLFALSLFMEQDYRFSQQLRIAAVYAADRTLLKQHILSLEQRVDRADAPLQPAPPISGPGRIPEDEEWDQNKSERLSDLLHELEAEIRSSLGRHEKDAASSNYLLVQDIIFRLEDMLKGLRIERGYKTENLGGAYTSVAGEYSLEHLADINEQNPAMRSQSEIIDLFIRSDPRMPPPLKTDFFKPEESAKRSLVDNEEVISETLAKLYVIQGNLKKAISIYRKLSLIFPEKSSYFAARIKNLEQELSG
ncbi:MAG: hypothetical protein JW861_07475 [Bacteroidales bacterium]|nr:hypothetical protein [Bacteroidales bacterium]